MTKRFTAQNARDRVVVPTLDYEEAIEDIKEACSDGKSLVYWYEVMDAGSVKILEQDGFKIKITRCQRGGDSTMISW